MREDKFGFVSDSEEEEKELKRIDKELSKYSKSKSILNMATTSKPGVAMGSLTAGSQTGLSQRVVPQS